MTKSVAEIRRISMTVLKRYGIKKAGLFGSVVRQEADANSDIDLLIEPDDKMSLFDFIRLKQELEEKLQRSVDLVDYATIKKHLRDIILREEKCRSQPSCAVSSR
jgi:predicted nucleotidyltransferase